MSDILLYTSILSATAGASLCAVAAYWLHKRRVRRLMKFFNQTYQAILGVIRDDPEYTVKVRPVVFKAWRNARDYRPYDWETDKKFEEIVKSIMMKSRDDQEPF